MQRPKSAGRVTSLRILGIIVSDRLTVTEHVNYLLPSCSSVFYALRVLRSHGIPAAALHDVFRATIVAKLTYGAPAWSCMCTEIAISWTHSWNDASGLVFATKNFRLSQNCSLKWTINFSKQHCTTHIMFSNHSWPIVQNSTTILEVGHIISH